MPESSHSTEQKSQKYLNSPDEHEDYPGQTLITRNHEVIRRWAEEHDAKPTTVPGSDYGGRPGRLLFDFPGYGGEDLVEISWDDWFRTFDERELDLIFQEHKKDGSPSNFFQLENPNRNGDS